MQPRRSAPRHPSSFRRQLTALLSVALLGCVSTPDSQHDAPQRYAPTAFGTTYTLDWPGSLWQTGCDCPQVGDALPVVGCVDASLTDPAQVGLEVCRGGICGYASRCPPIAGLLCGPPSDVDAVRLSDHTCSLIAPRGPGPPPADFADYHATESGDSLVRHLFEGRPGESGVRGGVWFNVSGGIPRAGATLEIARVDLQFGSFCVGGVPGDSVDVVSVVHRARIFGVFIDDRHFEIRRSGATFAVVLKVDPVGPSLLTGDTQTRTYLEYSGIPTGGSLDVSSGTFELNVVAGDGEIGFELTFHGQLDVAQL